MFNFHKLALSALASAAVLGLGACSDNNLVGVERVSSTTSGNFKDADVIAVAQLDGSNLSALLKIPKGAQLFDANGNVLAGDVVTVRLEVFDGTPVSEAFFDGGVDFQDPPLAGSLNNALNKNLNVSNPIKVDLAGFVRINASVGGVAVKSFSPPVGVALGLVGVAPGAKVANFSVDEVTIERQFEGSDTVDAGGNVSFTTDHLTAFGLALDVVPGTKPGPTPAPTDGTGGTGGTGATGAAGGSS